MENISDNNNFYEQELEKLSDLIINSINNFKSTNERYGYSTTQVNEFLDNLIKLIKGYKGCSYVETIENANTSNKKRLYEDDFGRHADLVINTINNVKFTQGWRGYDTAVIDKFLDDLIRLIKYHKNNSNIGNMIDISSLKNANFCKGFRGYNDVEVDNFLGKIALEFEKLNDIKRKYTF